jgi:hypothetical protein
MGTTDIGKRTEFRSGNMAMLSGMVNSEGPPPDPLSGGAGSDAEKGGREGLAMSPEVSTDLLQPHHTQHFE